MNDINVLPGDTLLLDPGKHGAVDVRARKNITVIGSGYFLDKNKDWAESQATIISFADLGEGCKIEGCDVENSISLDGDKATAVRCKANTISTSGGKNNLVSQCYVGILYLYSGSIARNNIVCNFVAGSNGCVFENNVVSSKGDAYYDYYSLVKSFSNSTIRNNILINTKQGFNASQIPYATNIFLDCTNCVIQNNVLSTPEKYADSTIPNNYFVGATIENTFVNEGSEDARWQLLDTSAAKGAATHGGDCGAFGGPTPYVLSGIPQFLPHITEALVPAKPTDGKITVKLKIANQNE